MKPYQVKLRIVGVLSLILAVLAAWLPLPSRAAGESPKILELKEKFVCVTDDTAHTITLIRYNNDAPNAAEALFIPEKSDISGTDYRILFNTDNVFENCNKLTTVEIDEAVLDGTQSVRNLFKGCTSLTSVKIINSTSFPATSIRNMDGMFEGCTSLTTVDLAALTGLNVVWMNNMFKDCTAIEEVDLSTFEPVQLQQVNNLFRGCTALKKVNLSKMSWESVYYQGSNIGNQDVFTGCNNLEIIEAPLGVGNLGDNRIVLPYTFKNGSEEHTILPPKLSSSVTLTRSTDVEGITLTPDEPSKAQELPEGDSTMVTVQLSPVFAANKKVFIESADGLIATVSPTEGDVDASGKATFSVTGVKANVDSNGNPQPTTVTITATADGDPTITATCSITVVAKVVDVTGIMITSDTDQTVPLPEELPNPIHIGETRTLAAPVTPNDNTSSATNHHVTWVSDNPAVATVTNTPAGENSGTGTDKDTPSKTTITGVRPGTAYITATSNNGGKTARVKVTVESQYDIYTNATMDKSADATTDTRSDCNNTKYTTASVPSIKLPITGNLFLQVSTPSSPAMKSQMDEGSFNAISYFILEVVDKDGNPATENIGDIEVTMALPGSMQPPNSTGQQLHLFAYDSSAPTANDLTANIIERTTFDNGNVDAVRFTVGSSSLPQEYAFAMNTDTTLPFSQYTLEAKDQRDMNLYQGSAYVSRTSETAQRSDMYLIVKEIDSGELKNRIENDPDLKKYQIRRYYDIYLATDPAGNNRVTYDFKSLDVYLSLLKEMDIAGEYRLFTLETGTSGTQELMELKFSDPNPKARKAVGINNGHHYVAFTATHFSEYGLLYNPPSGTTSGSTVFSSGGIVINVNIPSINITIDANGSIISGGGGTNSGSSGTQQSGQQQQQQQQASPAGTTIINYNYYGGTIPGNAGDMPTTGGVHMYRVLIVILLALSGLVEVMLSIPAKRRLHST